MKIMLDAGHYLTTPGKRSPDGMREYEFNSAVANAMKTELEKYEGVTVYFAHDGKTDVPLKERTDKANKLKVDVYVSLHANASTGKMGDWGGIDTFVYKTNPAEARKLAEVIQRNLIAATGLRNRGVKTADFHVLRETHMTAVLIEHGFMDSRTDLPFLKSDAYRKLCGVTNACSVAEFYGLKRKPEPKAAPGKKASTKANDGFLYKVQIGAFSKKENADALVKKAKEKGFDAFSANYGKLYKVQLGAFGAEANAEALAKKAKAAGFDVFIAKEAK